MPLCGWWVLITSHHPVKFSSNRTYVNKYLTKFIYQVTSRNYLIEGMCDFVFWHATPNYKLSVNFDNHRSRESKFITFFIWLVTLYDHVINRLCDFVDNRPVLEPTTLASLAVIGPAKVFHLPCDLTWSRDQSVKRLNGWRPVINLFFVKFGSHRTHGSGDISCFIFHVNSCLATWSLSLTHQSAKCDCHKSCGSADMIY